MQDQASIVIHKEVFPTLNIAQYLNDIKPIQSLTVENRSDTDLFSAVVDITSDLPCIRPFRYTMARIPARRDFKIPLDSLAIDRGFLDKLSETEKAVFTISVAGANGLVAKVTFAVLVQPLEYFGGLRVLPELIAAYVTPNHPYVYHIKRRAIVIGEGQGGKTAFTAYQEGDATQVLQTVSAIYSAIKAEEIVYSALAPGYEDEGQRLRLLHTIQKEKFANCIDMSLLFAACLEAIGLNPVLIIVKGHAFVGCWLQDDKLSAVVNDDKTAITKRLARGIREMVAIEVTCLCKGNVVSFSEALHLAEAQLIEKEEFLMAIDIRSARVAHIRPLPLRVEDTDRAFLDSDVQPDFPVKEGEGDFNLGAIYQEDLLDTDRSRDKQKIWERKLLDLSLRNNLLNLRMSRNMLQLVDLDISCLEDVLSEGKSFSLAADTQAPVLRKYNHFSPALHSSSPLYQTAQEELKHNRLLTYYHQQDLDQVLDYMYKNAKQAIEENGSGTLYLALGLLKWYDRKTPDQPRQAPILLLPVEIGRRSVNSRFTLRSNGEEALVNTTLLEFLRQEYELELHMLDQLPLDEKGVDVPKIMGLMRRAVMHLKGWDVSEQLVLGNFSFNKLILWKDIVEHREALQKSGLVKSLISGQLDRTIVPAIREEVDLEVLSSGQLMLPISADVSQMEAVWAARQGESFILHGPPGTGKSQTITNIIADALYLKKRVLFVAAKKAALDVVYRRLAQIGLAPFTLELHSNKSKKSDVLEQLSRTLSVVKGRRSADFSREAERLDNVRRSISRYVRVLHEPGPAGWSLYDSITALEAYRDRSFSRLEAPGTIVEKLDTVLWRQWEDWLPQFQSVCKLVTDPKNSPFAHWKDFSYTASLHNTLTTQTEQLVQLLPDIRRKATDLAQQLDFPFTLDTPKLWLLLSKVVHALQNMPDMSLAFCRYLSDQDQYSIYEEWVLHYQQYCTATAEILADYDKHILTLDIGAYEMQWRSARDAWFLPRWLGKRRIRKSLSMYRRQAFTSDLELEQLFAQYDRWKMLSLFIADDRFSVLRSIIGGQYDKEASDTGPLERKVALVRRLAHIMEAWAPQALSRWLQLMAENGVTQIAYLPTHYTMQMTDYLQACQAWSEINQNLDMLTAGVFVPESLNAEDSLMHLHNIKTHLPGLKNWANYRQLSRQGESLHLGWLIEAYEKGSCTSSELVDYCNYAVHTALAQVAIAQNESLSLFDALLWESKIEHYRKIAGDFQSLMLQELRLQLAGNVPDAATDALQSSELGILQRAIKSRGRGQSIRRLFDQLPGLLPRVAPCMLMSPISAAQYFTADTGHFDLVIFDEASQLPTCEAVSALARAKQAVIVGDPKQMPPTSFFNTIRSEEEYTDLEDLESILDDCLALSVPSKFLLRHYRSRHESLIAFSNVHYYENRLLTFPSADDQDRKVRYHEVAGFYDKGKTRTNRFEAAAIVRFIQSHYTDILQCRKSIGVVTFSQTQQSLVEDMLQELFMSDPGLEASAMKSDEPLFVKNLENVQGDERDIILFSVGYAPDEVGRMSMNFGPLNQNGGWRRLNVAVTRARYEMHVFATLRADQIDLGRTHAEGVAGLKAFLQFAERGQLSMRPEDLQEEVQRKHLSDAIAEQLRRKGLNINCNIGTSRFKIDLGIVHPERPQEYILGILLDGYYYYSARTTNDRDRVTPAVLKDLGWNIYRIWTLDWYEDAARIVDAVLVEIERLLSVGETGATAPDEEPQELPPVAELPETIDPREAGGKVRGYVIYKPAPVPGASSELIYAAINRDRLKQQIQMIMTAEAPISKSLLYRRLLKAWSISRVSTKLDKHLETVINEMALVQVRHHQVFYWNKNQNPMDYYRNNGGEKRDIDDIAPEELKVALLDTAARNLSIEEEELLRYMARLFGFAKLGKQVDVRLRYVIGLAIDVGELVREGERLKCAVAQGIPG